MNTFKFLSWVLVVYSIASCSSSGRFHRGALEVPTLYQPTLDLNRPRIDFPNSETFAGFAAYLLKSDPLSAQKLIDPLAQSLNPWALYGKAELFRRKTDIRARVLYELRICTVAASHPLCAVAARNVYSLTGISSSLDQAIETKARQALENQAPGDAAFFLRRAIAAVRKNQGDEEEYRKLLAQAGVLSQASLWGPYSRYQHLDWNSRFPPEQGDLQSPFAGPQGKVIGRNVHSPSGLFFLYKEPTTADIYYWVVDMEISEDAEYQLRVYGKNSFRVTIDGNLALERSNFASWPSQEQVAQVYLKKGRHRVLAKTNRTNDLYGGTQLFLSRADGSPSDLRIKPGQGVFATIPIEFRPLTAAYPNALSLFNTLEKEAGTCLAAFVASRNALNHDAEGAKELILRETKINSTAPLLVLRAEASLADASLHSKIAQGRAHRDFEAALAIDPTEFSALQRLSIHYRNQQQYDQATRLIERAKANGNSHWSILLSEIHIALAQRAEAVADYLAKKAIMQEPGLCPALQIRYDLARKMDSNSADTHLQNLRKCPSYQSTLATHHQLRGNLEEAQTIWEKIASSNPLDPRPQEHVARLASVRKQYAQAAALYESLIQAWPQDASLHLKKAQALELDGHLEEAAKERELALSMRGDNLALRRALAYRQGKEVLDDMRTDSASILEKYRRTKPPENSPVAYVLDASAIEVHPDGAFTERTHILAKAVDQKGVSLLAEIKLPPGAEALTLRTIKANGRILEPEKIEGKNGISFPGVEVGDFVEFEYLASTPSRGAALPGFATPKFYFRMEDGSIFHSQYSLRAPKGTGIEIDFHGNPPTPSIQKNHQYEQINFQNENIPPFVSEPHSVSSEELLPFVQIGTGAGLLEQMARIGDQLLDRTKPSLEVIEFARQAAGSKTGIDAVRAIYEKVMQEIKGIEGSLSTGASISLSQGYGSRILVLKSALRAIGIDSRIVLVRLFQVNPTNYRFPTPQMYGHAVLKILLPNHSPIFVDPAIRFAPFGEVSAQAQGQQAVVLPELGEKSQIIHLPRYPQKEDKKVAFRLSLSNNGTLSGKGEEYFQGFAKANLRTTLERMNQEQRRQSMEAAIASTFDNASLLSFSIDESSDYHAPWVIRYSFKAPGFARQQGKRLVISKGIYPSYLSRAFLSLSQRQSPLKIGTPQQLSLSIHLSLPASVTLSTPQFSRMDSPFGKFEYIENSKPGVFHLEESYYLPLARIPPEKYSDFSKFVSEIDRIQGREIIFE